MGLKGNTAKGILFIVLAAAGFSLMAVFVRLAGPLPVMQKVFFRNLVAALVAIIMLRRAGEPFRIGKGNRLAVFLRSFVGMLGVIANFWAIDHLPIADSTMLNKMSPFFAILMSLFILGERPVHSGHQAGNRSRLGVGAGRSLRRFLRGHGLYLCPEGGTGRGQGTGNHPLVFGVFLHHGVAADACGI